MAKNILKYEIYLLQDHNFIKNVYIKEIESDIKNSKIHHSLGIYF